MNFKRKQTKSIMIGNINIGNGAPIVIQSMTNTRTDDVEKTCRQIEMLTVAGCEIVRMAIPDMAAAEAVKSIKDKVNVPLVADIHFDYRLAVKAAENGIDALRINPGNIGSIENVRTVVDCAQHYGLPIRIGVNAGSLEKDILEQNNGRATAEGMVESALRHIDILEKNGFNNIKVSLKAHNVPLTIAAYRLLSERVQYPLHVGVTEAGTIAAGTIKSAIGIGCLLAEGIGDTIRVSLTGDPVEEIFVAKAILQSLELRRFGPELVSCPTCGRTQVELITLTQQVEERLKNIEKPITVAVMGCVVNGPGEAREADVGIAGGKGEGLLFRKGQVIGRFPENELINALFGEIEKL